MVPMPIAHEPDLMGSTTPALISLAGARQPATTTRFRPAALAS